MQERTWRVVAPVKGGSAAKSRLVAPPAHRAALARAVALDALAAAVASFPVVAEVLVVSGDAGVLEEVRALGARGVPESRRDAGLLAAVADGVAAAGPGPVAVLLPDVPCVRPDDLLAALAACTEALDAGAGSAFVPDAEGSGTVLLAALDPRDLRPAFGHASAAAHARTGAVPLGLDLPRLRRDVDTAETLTQALLLGVGPHTASAAAAGARASA